MNKILILVNILPIFGMEEKIALVKNDYWLTAIYAVIIVASLAIKRYPKDIKVFCFGFLTMIISEYFFVSTGVEVFNRHSLFGIMPLWLPFLWGYGFVVIKRAVNWI